MLSEKFKYIFVHIPKTAGKTLYTILPEGTHNYLAFPNNKMTNIGFRKMHLNTREIKHELGDKFDQYFKFCFVRNPWDKVVSEFFWRKQRPNRVQFESIEEMLLFIQSGKREEADLNRHLEPQFKMICDENNQIMVDYVARFERLKEEVKYIFHRINYPLSKEIPKINASERASDYRQYYTQHTRELVETIFREDIEMFDYEF